jgi:hypothetical protein
MAVLFAKKVLDCSGGKDGACVTLGAGHDWAGSWLGAGQNGYAREGMDE